MTTDYERNPIEVTEILRDTDIGDGFHDPEDVVRAFEDALDRYSIENDLDMDIDRYGDMIKVTYRAFVDTAEDAHDALSTHISAVFNSKW